MKTMHTRMQDVYKVMASIAQLHCKKISTLFKAKCKQLQLNVGKFFSNDTCDYNQKNMSKREKQPVNALAKCIDKSTDKYIGIV